MMRLKLIDRYMLQEMSAPFLIGLAAFLMVLCLNMAYFVLEQIVEKEVPLSEILIMIALRVPLYIVLALPVAILVASSFAMNRITRDRELVALRLAGVSLWRLLIPFAIFGVVFSIIAFAAEEYVAPVANHESDNMYRKLVFESNVPTLTPDTFFRVDNRVFYFHRAFRVAERTLLLQGVMLYQINGSNFPEIWSAREATVTGDVWTLKGVVMHHLDEHGRASVDGVPSNDMVLDLHRDMSFFIESQKLPEELTARELKRQIQNYLRMGVHDIYLAQQQYEYYSKFALPVACLLCALIGIPLNIRYARLGGFIGLFLALVTIFVYYNCMLFSRSLTYNGTIPPVLGAWIPDVLFGLICLVFIYREL